MGGAAARQDALAGAAVRLRRRGGAHVLWRARNVRGRRSRRGDAARMGARRALRRQFLLDRPRLHLERVRLRLADRKGAAPGAPAPAPGGEDGDRHADLQRGALAGLLGGAGDLRRRRGDRPRRRLRLFLPLRHHRSRTSGSPRSARCWRCASACPARGSITAAAARTSAARPAISPISSCAGAPPIRRWSCSTPTA